MSGVRASLRIARREAWRSKGRSALVVAMIGLPMLGLAFADVAARTGQLPGAEKARRELGAADLVAEVVDARPIVQEGLWGYRSVDEAAQPAGAPDTAPDIAKALPAGSRVVERRTFYGARLGSGTGDSARLTNGELERLDLHDPTSRGMYVLRRGTLPRGPREAAVAERTARDLRVGVGDTITVQGSAEFTVTAVVAWKSSLSAQKAFVPLAATFATPTGLVSEGGSRYAVTLPPGTDDVALVPALNALGVRALPRTWFLHPPPDPYSGMHANADEIGVAIVVVGLATLEIVLLAGTAFAVGARRKRRELALVAATGGDRRDVRRIVLAEGVVLGLVAGLLGVGIGILAVVLGRPVLDRVSGVMLGPLDLRPLELGAIVAVAVGTALLATLLPARAAARQSVVAALTGRRGEVRGRRRVPVIALCAVAAGAALAFWAAGDGATVQVSDAMGNTFTRPSGRPANFPLVLTGAVLAELGFVACAPALVGLVGRLAKPLPLSLRLAARDAARHRTRSGPAVAAVVAAVAGSVALSVYVASDTERQRREYEPTMPSGAVAIGFGDPTVRDRRRDVDAAVATLPVRARYDTYDVATMCDGTKPCESWAIDVPAPFRCTDGMAEDPWCVAPGGPMGGNITAASPEYLPWWLGRDDPATVAALRAGKAVVFDERWLQQGEVVVAGRTHDVRGRLLRSERVRLPAHVVDAPRLDSGYRPVLVVTPETARRHGLPVMPSRTFVVPSRPPTGAEEARARAILSRAVGWADLYVERGFRSETPLTLLVLVLGAAVVTLGATGVATGLAAADSRPDLATLAAVGAAPRVRRRLAMAQAATVAALGTGLGILAGLVPSMAVVGARAEYPLALPWTSFAAIAVGVPVVAALLVGLVTRSRLPLERRIA